MRKQKRRKNHVVALIIPLALLILLIISVSIAVGGSARKESENVDTGEQKPVPLVISIPKPCHKGMLTVYGKGEVLYQYGGEIKIVNDGRNGEDIEIVIEYPDEYCLPNGAAESESKNE